MERKESLYCYWNRTLLSNRIVIILITTVNTPLPLYTQDIGKLSELSRQLWMLFKLFMLLYRYWTNLGKESHFIKAVYISVEFQNTTKDFSLLNKLKQFKRAIREGLRWSSGRAPDCQSKFSRVKIEKSKMIELFISNWLVSDRSIRCTFVVRRSRLANPRVDESVTKLKLSDRQWSELPYVEPFKNW